MLAITRTLRTAAFIAALCAPTVCVAQRQAKDPVETKGVGISGGIIAGAELSLLIESFADVKPVWPWIVLPIITAAGGGVGGYYLDKSAPEGAIAVLVTSMALLIPTTIAVSIAREYEPGEGVKLIDESGGEKYSFEKPPAEPVEGAQPETVTEVESRPDEIPPGEAQPPGDGVEGPQAPPAEPAPAPVPAPGSSGGTSAHLAPHAAQPAWARHLSSGSLLHVDRDLGAGVGVPSIDVRPVYLIDEAALAAPRSGVEFRVSLLKIDLP